MIFHQDPAQQLQQHYREKEWTESNGAKVMALSSSRCWRVPYGAVIHFSEWAQENVLNCNDRLAPILNKGCNFDLKNQHYM